MTCNFNVAAGEEPKDALPGSARPDHFGWLLYAFGKFGLHKNAISTTTAKMY